MRPQKRPIGTKANVMTAMHRPNLFFKIEEAIEQNNTSDPICKNDIANRITTGVSSPVIQNQDAKYNATNGG